MANILDLPLELLNRVVQEIILRDSVGAAAVHRLVCRAFNHYIRASIFLHSPEEVFWNPVGRMLIVNNLDYFLTAQGDELGQHGYRTAMSVKIGQMMKYLISQRVFGSTDAEYDNNLKILCAGLKTIMGTQTIARAIIVNDPDLADHSPTWWAVFHTNGPLETSVKVNISMIVGAHALVIDELKNLSDDWHTINLIYGDPLTNAIKLGDITMLNTIINHLTTMKLVPKRQRGHLVPSQARSAFPLEDSVSTAIMYNRPDMAGALVQIYQVQFGNPVPSIFESWLCRSLIVGNSALVKTLYRSHGQRRLKLSSLSVAEFLKTGDYNMVLEVFSPLTQPLQDRFAKKDPLYITLRHRNIDAARALLATGKVDINREVLHNHSGQFGNAALGSSRYASVMIAPLDVACRMDDYAMLEFLLTAGANYRRRFAIQLNGRCYYTIRKWAALPQNGGHTHMPEYGHYYSMSYEEQLAYVFG
ncbi:hypothetical protein HBI51_209520 [Parastagonospora nodorum]|nr:hypothetical protein HBI51_209520 [Parastagonospora nodorum]